MNMESISEDLLKEAIKEALKYIYKNRWNIVFVLYFGWLLLLGDLFKIKTYRKALLEFCILIVVNNYLTELTKSKD